MKTQDKHIDFDFLITFFVKKISYPHFLRWLLQKQHHSLIVVWMLIGLGFIVLPDANRCIQENKTDLKQFELYY